MEMSLSHTQHHAESCSIVFSGLLSRAFCSCAVRRLHSVLLFRNRCVYIYADTRSCCIYSLLPLERLSLASLCTTCCCMQCRSSTPQTPLPLQRLPATSLPSSLLLIGQAAALPTLHRMPVLLYIASTICISLCIVFGSCKSVRGCAFFFYPYILAYILYIHIYITCSFPTYIAAPIHLYTYARSCVGRPAAVLSSSAAPLVHGSYP